MSTIFETLRAEHNEARNLLDLVSKTHGNSRSRRELFTKLKKELDDHTAAEEAVFYKPLLGTDAQNRAARSIMEHELIRERLEALAHMDFSNPHWIHKFNELRAMVQHHMDAEEHEVFQQASRILDDGNKESISSAHEEYRRHEAWA